MRKDYKFMMNYNNSKKDYVIKKIINKEDIKIKRIEDDVK